MPSSNAAGLQSMAQQLQMAAAGQDWLRVAQLDQLLGQWLQAGAVPAQSLSAEMQLAWRQVQSAHDQALQACQRAKGHARVQLDQLQQSQEAQQAYAWQEVLK